jgi:TonB family protein
LAFAQACGILCWRSSPYKNEKEKGAAVSQLATARFGRKAFVASLLLAAANAHAQADDTAGVSSDSTSIVTADELAPASTSQCDLQNLRPAPGWQVKARQPIVSAVTAANQCLAQRDSACVETTLATVAGQLATDDERALVAIPQAELVKQRGDYDAAERIYQDTMALPSLDASLRLELVRRAAYLQHDRKNHVEVLRMLNTNFSCDAWTADALTLRALAYEGLYSIQLALESYEGAINLYEQQGRPLPTGLQGRYQALAAQHDPTKADAADVVPLVRINPQYPELALRRRREGWVQMQFDITDTGTVANAHVVSSSDPMFDDAALTALRQWRYKPKITDGLPVARPGVQTIIRFQLEL